MRPLSARDVEWLCEEAAHAIRRQQPLPTILLELSGAAETARRRRVTRRLAAAVASGRTLSQAVADWAGCFPFGTAAALEAGERAGQLPEVLDSLAESARSDSSLRFSITHSIAYPVVLALAAAGALTFIQIAILPQFRRMYGELDVNLPALTKIVLAPGMLLYGPVLILLAPALLLALLYLVPAPLLPGRRLWDAVRIWFPFIGRALRHQLLVRWCGTMGMLVRAGVPEPQAVRLAGESVGNVRVAMMSRKLADRLAAGESLPDLMSRKRFFPPPLAWMVGVSQRIGGHGHVWPIAQELYDEQARRIAFIASVVLRVVFIILAIQVVGFTISSLFLPLIRLMNVLGG